MTLLNPTSGSLQRDLIERVYVPRVSTLGEKASRAAPGAATAPAGGAAGGVSDLACLVVGISLCVLP